MPLPNRKRFFFYPLDFLRRGWLSFKDSIRAFFLLLNPIGACSKVDQTSKNRVLPQILPQTGLNDAQFILMASHFFEPLSCYKNCHNSSYKKTFILERLSSYKSALFKTSLYSFADFNSSKAIINLVDFKAYTSHNNMLIGITPEKTPAFFLVRYIRCRRKNKPIAKTDLEIAKLVDFDC